MKLPHLMDVDDWEWDEWRAFFLRVKESEGEEAAWVCIRRLFQKSFRQGIEHGRTHPEDKKQ